MSPLGKFNIVGTCQISGGRVLHREGVAMEKAYFLDPTDGNSYGKRLEILFNRVESADVLRERQFHI